MWYDTIDPEIAKRYTQGKCDVFARALWIAHGHIGHVAILVKSPRARYCHIYYEHPSRRLIDIFGPCDRRTAKRRWGWGHFYYRVDPDEAWQLRQLTRSDRCGGHVSQALRVIDRDPGRYILA